MKRLAIAAAASMMTFAALPAAAASMGMGERPELGAPRMAAMTVERRAGDLYETKDLVRRGLMANDIVTVTELRTSNRPVDYSSRNGG